MPMSSTRCAAGVLVGLFACAALDARQQGVPEAVRASADAISSEQLAWDLAYLASDEQQGRNTPSPRFDAAADYIATRLARAGLKPAGDAGTFLERGILTIGFTTGIHPRYHLPADEAQFLDPVQVHAIARTVFASLWALADAAERPRIDRPIPPSVPKHP